MPKSISIFHYLEIFPAGYSINRPIIVFGPDGESIQRLKKYSSRNLKG